MLFVCVCEGSGSACCMHFKILLPSSSRRRHSSRCEAAHRDTVRNIKEEKKSDDDNDNHGDNDNDDDDESDETVDVDGVFVTNEEYAAVKKLQERYDEQIDLLTEEVARCQRLQRRIESLEREIGRLDQARTNENTRLDITVNTRERTDK